MELIKDLGMKYATADSKSKSRFGLFKCTLCTVEFRALTHDVKRRNMKNCKSCAMKKHGLSTHKLYNTWKNELSRCNNKTHRDYKWYGKRGIDVSDEFYDFSTWLEYVESLDNCYRDTYTVDRINNDLGYNRCNIRWITKAIQARNTQIIRSTNTSGFRGVSFDKVKLRWESSITVNYKKIFIGYFDYPWTAAYSRDNYILNNELEHTRNFK